MGRSGDPYATDTLVQLMQAEGDTLCERELDMLMACGELISSAIVAQAITAAGHRAVALSGGQAGIITDDSFGEAKILEVRSQRLIELIQSVGSGGGGVSRGNPAGRYYHPRPGRQ